MPARGAIGPGLTKVLVIAGSWTFLLVLTYVGTYLLIGDLLRQGTLSGRYDFWPDGVDLIASSVLLGRMPAATYQAAPIGEITLRGKTEPLLLSAVAEA